MVGIQATVEATDFRGLVAKLRLVSIVSSEEDDGQGDGHTSGDIAGAELNTLDQSFQLRAERMGHGRDRVYTVTFQATDDAQNRREVSAVVTVRNPNQ